MIIQNLILSCPDIAFSNNPIPLSISCNGVCNIVVHILSDQEIIYESAYFVPGGLKIDISDVVKTIVSAPDGIAPQLFSFTDIYRIRTYHIKVYDAQDNDLQTELTKSVVYGGFSKRFIRNTTPNYLSEIINNSALLLSTRSSGRFFVFRETEISTIRCVTKANKLRITSPEGNVVDINNGNPTQDFKICTINLMGLRYKFMTDYDELPSYLSFVVNGKFTFQIVFTPGVYSEEIRLIRFLNSLGSHENIQVWGNEILSITDTENDTYKGHSVWDPDIMDYISVRKRKAKSRVLQVNSGFRNHTEFDFMQDLICSSDIYLVSKGRSDRVLIDVDDFEIQQTKPDPMGISIKLTMVDNDANYYDYPDNTIPDAYPGEWFLERGYINSLGIINNNSVIKS